MRRTEAVHTYYVPSDVYEDCIQDGFGTLRVPVPTDLLFVGVPPGERGPEGPWTLESWMQRGAGGHWLPRTCYTRKYPFVPHKALPPTKVRLCPRGGRRYATFEVVSFEFRPANRHRTEAIWLVRLKRVTDEECYNAYVDT